MSVKVRAIPATKPIVSAAAMKTVLAKRRVAAYARVSTASEEQATSYEAQVSYYTALIQSRSDWTLAGIYTDEGISGTSTKHRAGFQSMITDALEGKIDLIVTKSVSRFARNTVDSLTTVRQLKDKGVEIYFEKENIWTLDAKGELLITIMSSLAQEESRSISENVRWGRRKSFQDGKVCMPYPHFLGYVKGHDGKPQVDPEQARVVRRIYSMFLSGYSYRQIATTFTNEGIPVPGVRGKRWHAATIKSILTNERYKGDALLQKTFIEDFLTKKQRRNEGQMPQYYVTGSHEAIIDPDTWELVQYEVKARKGRRTPFAFSMKLKCSVCGGWYGSKTWHSNDKYRSMIWQCNNKYNNDHPQGMPHPVDAELEAAFNAALHELLQARPIITATIENAINKTTDTTHLEREISELALKVEGLQARIEKEIRANSKQAQDQTEYQKRFEELQTQYNEALSHYNAKASELEERNGKARQMRHILATLSQIENSPVGFDFRLWHVLVDHMLISPDGQIRVQWKWLPEVEKQ